MWDDYLLDGVSHHEAIVNGVRLHYVEAGAGPLVVLLHGFPEFWYSWRRQIPALAAAGFRVVAPDMRGYNRSEKPPGVASYRAATVAADIAALIRHLGAENALVVGHDWGGAIAWTVAINHPDVTRALAVCNAPHPAAMLRELRTPAQLRKSWYIFAFQLPVLPELLFKAGKYAAMRRTMEHDPVRPGTFSKRDIGYYRTAMDQPGARTATINYYRALLRQDPRRVSAQANLVAAPTLLIWGECDNYLGLSLTEGLEPWVPYLRVERVPDASHWVAQDAPERVNTLLVAFAQEHQH